MDDAELRQVVRASLRAAGPHEHFRVFADLAGYDKHAIGVYIEGGDVVVVAVKVTARAGAQRRATKEKLASL